MNRTSIVAAAVVAAALIAAGSNTAAGQGAPSTGYPGPLDTPVPPPTMAVIVFTPDGRPTNTPIPPYGSWPTVTPVVPSGVAAGLPYQLHLTALWRQ